MSFFISTDIFCDGEDCNEWVFGASGDKTKRRDANVQARCQGWTMVAEKHFCPACKPLDASAKTD